MLGLPDRTPALPRTAVALIVLVVTGQVVAAFHAGVRTELLGLSLLLTDLLGLAYAWRAAGRSPSRLTWRLLAAGRGLSAISTISFAVAVLVPGPLWWWVAVAGGLAMMVAVSAAVLTMATLRLDGQRGAFIAEMATVLCSGFLLLWYAVVHPATHDPAGTGWPFEIGYPVANLLLLSAVAAVLLRGGVASLTRPQIALAAGVLLYSVSDIAFTTVHIHDVQGTVSPPASTGLVIASLMLTVAAMWQAGTPAGDRLPVSRMPAWSAHLPYVAVGLGGLVVLVAAVREEHSGLWTGLIAGLLVLTTAMAVRQMLFLRDSRRQIVTDALTGLANVTGLRRTAAQAVAGGGDTALLMIDLDGFQEINDQHGHTAGDRVLVGFARLLRASVRRSDLAARVGGDAFAVLLTGTAAEPAATVAERLLAALAAEPMTAAAITVRASIGLATTDGVESADELQRHADLAMYESKRSGGNRSTAYDPAMTDRRQRDRLIGDRILPGLAAGQFEVVYQPLVRMSTGATVGVEALLRWHAGDLGPVSPVEFIPLAERSGAIVELGRWVLETACAQVQQWRSEGHTELYASVNISPHQLRGENFVAGVRDVLARTGLPAAFLALEITESAIVDEEIAVPALQELRRLGAQVSIDDFGTGYSSLQYLTRLPVDVLKIDRSFVARLDTTAQGAAVAEAIIRLAQVLGLRVVAEGIENPAQAAELQVLGCDTGQGYLFARPMRAADCRATFPAPASGAEVTR